MFRLRRTSHGCLFNAVKIHFENPTFLIPISHLHDPRKALVPDSEEGSEFPSTEPSQRDRLERDSLDACAVPIWHPWPEWIELMRQLLLNGYVESADDPFRNGKLDARDANRVRSACLNFARDRFDLMRNFSRMDIQIVAGSGCPNIDRKVVNSGKRLRAHVGIDEGNVCRSCVLRGDCDRAYVNPRKDEDGRTVDVMRFLLTYGLDPYISMVENKPCLNKAVEQSVRSLLKETLEYCKKQVDSSSDTFPKLNSSIRQCSTYQEQEHINFPVKQKIDSKLCQEKLRRPMENEDHPLLKKGDWICSKCNFFNYAKNTRCLRCNGQPPKRQLNPGEWECASCNYINFRRNVVCIKCDHRRPRALNSELISQMQR